ncbi:MAG: hypothetical protein NVS3B10_20020 [Polyangiales bacterium]
MSRSVPSPASLLAQIATLTLLLAPLATTPGCERKPIYDDAPIARADRKKKQPEPKETFDLEKICAQLVDLPGPDLASEVKPELRDTCRKGLSAMESTRPEEYLCRCHCIRSAGDILAVERCSLHCGIDDPERVCDHAAPVEEKSGEAGLLDDAHRQCVKDLQHLREVEPTRWACKSRCLLDAPDKDEALGCEAACAGAKGPSPSIDASGVIE